MKRQFQITIQAQIVFDLQHEEFLAIMNDVVYFKRRFFVLMDCHGHTESRPINDVSIFNYYETAVCPDARFIKMLLSWLNSRYGKISTKLIVRKFNQSFTTDYQFN